MDWMYQSVSKCNKLIEQKKKKNVPANSTQKKWIIIKFSNIVSTLIIGEWWPYMRCNGDFDFSKMSLNRRKKWWLNFIIIKNSAKKSRIFFLLKIILMINESYDASNMTKKNDYSKTNFKMTNKILNFWSNFNK